MTEPTFHPDLSADNEATVKRNAVYLAVALARIASATPGISAAELRDLASEALTSAVTRGRVSRSGAEVDIALGNLADELLNTHPDGIAAAREAQAAHFAKLTAQAYADIEAAARGKKA